MLLKLFKLYLDISLQVNCLNGTFEPQGSPNISLSATLLQFLDLLHKI